MDTETKAPTEAVEVSSQALVALLFAAAGRVRVPTDPWPLEIAVEELKRRLDASTPVGRAAHRWRTKVTSGGASLPGLAAAVRRLSRGGHLAPEGRGWDAGYRPTRTWIVSKRRLLTALPDRDQRAIYAAAQRLVASATTWSKNARACVPSRSSTR